eukprot:14077528-Alexandrium_andersonii.AAC.1
MAPHDALRVLHGAIDQGCFASFVYDLFAHRELSDGHAIADSRRSTVKKVQRILMRALHSDTASGMICQLGPEFEFLGT